MTESRLRKAYVVIHKRCTVVVNENTVYLIYFFLAKTFCSLERRANWWNLRLVPDFQICACDLPPALDLLAKMSKMSKKRL